MCEFRRESLVSMKPTNLEGVRLVPTSEEMSQWRLARPQQRDNKVAQQLCCSVFQTGRKKARFRKLGYRMTTLSATENFNHKIHGVRCGRVKSLFASSSLTKRSFAGSHCKARPRS